MSPDAVVRAWFKEVWDEGNEDAIDRLMAADAVAHGLGADEIRGPEAFKPYVRAMRGRSAISRSKSSRRSPTAIASPRIATSSRDMSARCSAPPRTNRPVDFWGIAIVRVRDGQIVEGWNCFDFLRMYQQMGWVKDPPLPQ